MTIEHTYNASLRCRKLIGTTAQWVVDPAINIDVTVLDVGNMFGNIRFLIKPIAGIGEKWVDMKYMIFQAGGIEVSRELLNAT